MDCGSHTGRRVVPGDRILDYRILAPIGRGGFGQVHRAVHEVLGRVVAIKIPHDADGLPSLRRSARIQAALGERGIVRALEASLSHDPPFVVYEHVDGKSLAEVVAEGPLPWRRAVPLLVDVALALRHAHDRGVVHGDVKPANILVEVTATGGERARLTDFGSVDADAPGETAEQVSSSVSLDTTRRSEVVGTVFYLAPEVARGGRPDATADVYAFGVLLFEVLTGRLPEGHELPSDLVAGIPHELDTAFLRCFARRERRAARLDEIVDLMATAFSSEAIRIAAPPVSSRPGSTNRRSPFEGSKARVFEAVMFAALVALTVLSMTWLPAPCLPEARRDEPGRFPWM
jgi:serine/threonine protein kinase